MFYLDARRECGKHDGSFHVIIEMTDDKSSGISVKEVELHIRVTESCRSQHRVVWLGTVLLIEKQKKKKKKNYTLLNTSSLQNGSSLLSHHII